MTFQRARSQEQIEQRREDIIRATVDLYEEIGLEKLNFSVISKKTGLTRPTIYNYFNTKEEILMQVIVQDFRSWTEELIGQFKLNKIYEIEEIADIWVASIANYPRFMELYSILFTILERNCSIEILAQFKRDLLAQHSPLLNLMTQLIPEAETEDINGFLLLQLTGAMGLFPMSFASEDQLQAIKLSETGYQIPDFKKFYRLTIYQLLFCLKNKIS